MTKELAIRILNGDVLGTLEQTQEAVTMAVKALSQPDVTDINVGDTIYRQAAVDMIVDKGTIVDSEVKCLSCGHHVAEKPFEVYCNIMCKWVNEKDCCTMFETRTHD